MDARRINGCLLLMVFMLLLAGCHTTGEKEAMVNQNKNEADFVYTYNITLPDVIEACAEEGIELTEIPGAGQSIRLNEVTPSVFSVNRTEETMLVYVCPSIEVRKLIAPESPYSYTWPGDDNYLCIPKECKNVLIINKLPLTSFSKTGFYPYDRDRWRRLGEAAWKLNDAQELVLTGKSAHWEGKTVIKQYSHWYQDKDGLTRYDNYSKGTIKIKYLGQPDRVHSVKYAMHYPSGYSRGTNDLDKEGYLSFPDNSGNNYINGNAVYNITLEWNGHKEKLVLKNAKLSQTAR